MVRHFGGRGPSPTVLSNIIDHPALLVQLFRFPETKPVHVLEQPVKVIRSVLILPAFNRTNTETAIDISDKNR